jgi:DNA-binding NtrC family response regulator
VGDAALARQCLENRPWSIEIAEAATAPDLPSAGGPLPFDILLVEHDYPGVDAFALLKDTADRGLQVPVILVVEWDEKLAMPALKLGAMDCVVKGRIRSERCSSSSIAGFRSRCCHESRPRERSGFARAKRAFRGPSTRSVRAARGWKPGLRTWNRRISTPGRRRRSGFGDRAAARG